MNRQHYRNIEMEVNTKDVIWNLLKQWKAILITALVMAMIVAGAKYYKSRVAYNATLKQMNESASKTIVSAEEQISNILAGLSGEDQATLKLVLQQEAWLDNQKEYFNNSLLLSLDPNAQRQLTLSYYLYDAEGKTYNALREAYTVHLKDKAFADVIKEQLQLDAEEEYVKELIRGVYTPSYGDEIEGDVLHVVISLPESADASNLEKEITLLMNDYSKELSQKISPHKIKFIESNDTVGVNENAAVKRTNTINNINSLNTSITNFKKAMTDEQRVAYSEIETIMASKANRDNMSDEKEDEGLNKPGFSKKYALLGFAVGVMGYAFIYLLTVIVGGRVSSADDAENYTGVRLLGEVNFHREHNRLDALLNSKIVDRIRYKDIADTDKQIDKLSNAIDAVSKHVGVKELTAVEMSNCSEELVSKLREKGVKLNTFNPNESEEKDYLNIKNALFFVGKDTKISELIKQTRLCDEYDIKVLGSAFTSEI